MTQPNADTIYIKDLVFDTIIGVLPQERTTPQPICINIEVTTDTRTAAESAQLSDTLNYAALADAVKKLTIDAQCLLVETLAAKIAERVLSDPQAHAVLVDISKPRAIGEAQGVGVRIYRQRQTTC